MNFDDTIMQSLNHFYSTSNEEAIRELETIEEDVTSMLKHMFMEFDEKERVEGFYSFGSGINKVEFETEDISYPFSHSLDRATRKSIILKFNNSLLARRNENTKEFEVCIGRDPETDEPRYIPFNKKYGKFRLCQAHEYSYDNRYRRVMKNVEEIHSKLGDMYPINFNKFVSRILKKVLDIHKFQVEVTDYSEMWTGDDFRCSINFKLTLNNTKEVDKLTALEIECLNNNKMCENHDTK